jgi:hypothetical protein
VVKPKLINAVNSTKEHQLQLEDMSYSFFSNSLTFSRISYQFSDNARKINVDSPELSVTSVPWINLLTGGTLSFGRIILNDPQIIIEEKETERVIEKEEEEIDLIDRIREMLPEDHQIIEAGSFVINNGELIRKSDNKPEDDFVKNAYLEVNGIFISKEKPDQQLPFRIFESAQITLRDVFMYFPQDAYEMKISTLNLTTKDSAARVEDFSYKSLKNINEYFKGKQYRTNKLDITVPLVELSGVNFPGVLWDDLIDAGNINISEAKLDFLTNKRVPKDPSIIPRMPHELISSLEYNINISELKIDNSFVSLREIWPNTEETSRLEFTNVNTTFKNISSSAGADNPAVISASANIADAGKIEVEMNIPLKTNIFRFSYQGSLGSMSALALNPHLRIADRSEITSGDIKNAEFKVDAVGDSVSAGIVPIYNDLEIKTLTGESKEGEIYQDIKTLFANAIKIRKSNPDPDGKIKSGNIIFLREQKDFFLEIVWFSIRDALGEVVGF